MSGVYIPKGYIPEYGHKIVIPSDCHAYFDNSYGDLGEVILVSDHGRLIDVDALISKCGEWYVEEGPEEGFIGTLRMLLEEQPVIIESNIVNKENA